MADNIQTSGSGGGHGGLYFIVGALVVVVGIGAFFLFGGSGMFGGHSKTGIDIKIETPKAPTKTQ